MLTIQVNRSKLYQELFEDKNELISDISVLLSSNWLDLMDPTEVAILSSKLLPYTDTDTMKQILGKKNYDISFNKSVYKIQLLTCIKSGENVSGIIQHINEIFDISIDVTNKLVIKFEVKNIDNIDYYRGKDLILYGGPLTYKFMNTLVYPKEVYLMSIKQEIKNTLEVNSIIFLHQELESVETIRK